MPRRVLLVALVLVLAGCSKGGDEPPAPTAPAANETTPPTEPPPPANETPPTEEPPAPAVDLGPLLAVADLRAVTREGVGGDVVGRVVLVHTPAGLDVQIAATGLPAGDHGVHVHENPECAPGMAAPANSTIIAAGAAGRHLNPERAKHGAHPGDLGNVRASADGVASGARAVANVSLADEPASFANRSIVVHELPDDGVTDPDGGSGARVLCGVVRLVDAAPDHRRVTLHRVTVDSVARDGSGYASLLAMRGGVFAAFFVTNLTGGVHGVHVHREGSCEPGAASPTNATVIAAGAAGPHYNPGNARHPDHAGDLGNLNATRAPADANATAAWSAVDASWRAGVGLGPTPPTLAGRALVVHARPDDLATDPSGNSGDRVLCGVV